MLEMSYSPYLAQLFVSLYKNSWRKVYVTGTRDFAVKKGQDTIPINYYGRDGYELNL